MKDAVEQAEQHGYVTTLFGRRRQIPEIRARNWQTRKLGERLAVNSVIQGTAADIIKVAMVRAHRALADEGLKTRLILQIHDELLAEGPAEEAEKAAEVISREMVAAADLDPPLKVDAGSGPNWLEAKISWTADPVTDGGTLVDKGVAVAVAAVVGGLVVTQAPLNSQLGRVVGSVNASAVALAVSCVALLALAAVTDGLGGIRNLGDAPLHVAIGGGWRARSTSAASSSRSGRSAPAGSPR